MLGRGGGGRALLCVLAATAAVCAASSGAGGVDPSEVEGSPEWWQKRKDEASKKAGRRVWAWELDPPSDHPMWVNKSAPPQPALRWTEGGKMADLHTMELVPRPEMPNWWCPTVRPPPRATWQPCGTLDLGHPLAAHCFPPDGSAFHICCTRIQLPDPDRPNASAFTPSSPVDTSDLASRIRAASHPSNPSWCVCDAFVCEELLGGIVTWDQHSLTRARYVHDQLSLGFDLTGYDWLAAGIPNILEYGNTEVPEDDPMEGEGDPEALAGAAACLAEDLHLAPREEEKFERLDASEAGLEKDRDGGGLEDWLGGEGGGETPLLR